MPFVTFPLPPTDLLDVELTIGGELQYVFGAELSLEISGIDDETDPEHWRPAERPAVTLLLLVITDTLWFRLKLPPAAFGLSLGCTKDLSDAQLEHVDDAPQSPRLFGRVAQSVFARPAAGELQGELSGALGSVQGDAAAFACRFRGTLQSADAMALRSQGRPQAEAWLKQVWPQADFAGTDPIEETSIGAGENKAISLSWRPRAWADERARQLAVHADFAEERRRAREHKEAQKAAAIAALRARPVPEPTAEAPLVAARSGHAVAGATISIFIAWYGEPGTAGTAATDSPTQRFNLELSIDVNDASGEDGALAPDFRFATTTLPWRLPIHGDWQTCTDGEIEAWFGNDAPELEASRFAWRFIGPDEVEIDWTARYDDWDTRQPELLHYRGRARVESIWLEAASEEALPAAAQTAFDAASLARLRLGAPKLRKGHDGVTWLAPVAVIPHSAPEG